MNIAFAADENYTGPLAVGLNSLLRHTEGTFRIYIIDGGITEQSWNGLSEIVSGPGRTLVRLTVPKERIQGAKASGWVTETAFFRIVLPELVSDQNRILYLDCDLLIRNDLRRLYDSDLGSHIVGAVEDSEFQEFHRLGIQKEDRYFNSGVMLINVSAWNRIDMTNKVLRHILEHPESATYWDQCHLNACLTGRWRMLHPRWNVQWAMLKGAAMRKRQNSPEIVEARRHPGIVHFNSEQKPWLSGTVQPYKRGFKQELAMTPFRGWKPSNVTREGRSPFTPKAFVRRGQFLFTFLHDRFFRVSSPQAGP
jgi:lipopolysaccharide biosynthesis glycosyltransferase